MDTEWLLWIRGAVCLSAYRQHCFNLWLLFKDFYCSVSFNHYTEKRGLLFFNWLLSRSGASVWFVWTRRNASLRAGCVSRNRYVALYLLNHQNQNLVFPAHPERPEIYLWFLSSLYLLKESLLSMRITHDILQTASSSLLIMQYMSWRQFTELLKYWCLKICIFILKSQITADNVIIFAYRVDGHVYIEVCILCECVTVEFVYYMCVCALLGESNVTDFCSNRGWQPFCMPVLLPLGNERQFNVSESAAPTHAPHYLSHVVVSLLVNWQLLFHSPHYLHAICWFVTKF